MAERTITITQEVVVEHDPTAFTLDFLAEFQKHFYPFIDVEDHLRHLAQLYARGLVDDFGERFIEGYGPASEFGLHFRIVRQEEDLQASAEAENG